MTASEVFQKSTIRRPGRDQKADRERENVRKPAREKPRRALLLESAEKE